MGKRWRNKEKHDKKARQESTQGAEKVVKCEQKEGLAMNPPIFPAAPTHAELVAMSKRMIAIAVTLQAVAEYGDVMRHEVTTRKCLDRLESLTDAWKTAIPRQGKIAAIREENQRRHHATNHFHETVNPQTEEEGSNAYGH